MNFGLPARRTRLRLGRGLGIGALAGGLLLTSETPALAGNRPAYKDSWRPVKVRVADLLSRMSLDDKLGQLMRAERLGVTGPDDVTAGRLGSLLSGGSSQSSPNTPVTWADMRSSPGDGAGRHRPRHAAEAEGLRRADGGRARVRPPARHRRAAAGLGRARRVVAAGHLDVQRRSAADQRRRRQARAVPVRLRPAVPAPPW